MSEVVFKRAAVTDAPSLVDLRLAFLAEVAGADPADTTLRESLSHYFATALSAGEFIAFLALAGDRAIAASGLVFHRHPPSHKNLNGLEAYVMNMYTVPAWRGRGIASSLLIELVAVARQSNCRRIRLHAFPRAMPVYTRIGFVPVDSELELDLR